MSDKRAAGPFGMSSHLQHKPEKRCFGSGAVSSLDVFLTMHSVSAQNDDRIAHECLVAYASMMTLTQTARLALRHATSDWHRRVDDAFSTADLANREDYGSFLLAQAAAVLPVEQMLDKGAIAAALTDWPQRRRAAALEVDLRALGLELPALEVSQDFHSVEAMLGAVYVLEGSRLGGALLKRSVPADLPTAFLSSCDSAAWRNLLLILDERLCDAEKLSEATRAACDVFALFERSGRQFLKATHSCSQTQTRSI